MACKPGAALSHVPRSLNNFCWESILVVSFFCFVFLSETECETFVRLCLFSHLYSPPDDVVVVVAI